MKAATWTFNIKDDTAEFFLWVGGCSVFYGEASISHLTFTSQFIYLLFVGVLSLKPETTFGCGSLYQHFNSCFSW